MNTKQLLSASIDGDPIVVDIDLGFDMTLKQQSIRLYGVDTPETRTKNQIEKKCGLVAKEYVKSIAKENHK